jgi:2-polyprenyl-3-methyl-5-hydroxy-6-metoxy-1,4-benzoquinol methylase
MTIKCEKSSLDNAYDREYRNIAVNDLDSSIQPQEFLKKKAYLDFSNLGPLHGKDVLEIGPGQGHLAQMISNAGANLTIADVIPHYLDTIQGNTNIKTLLVDIQKLGLFESFDLIIMCDVLEHVFRPADALLWAYQALKPNGKLYIRVPSNESNIFYSTSLGYPYELVHLRTYTRSILTRELLASGFKIEKQNFLFKTDGRIPKNWVPGTKRYWRIMRSSIANQGYNDLSFLDKVIEGILKARFKDSYKLINFILKIVRNYYTYPVEISALAVRPK